MAAHYEKQGTIVNSGRLITWRYQAVQPLGRHQVATYPAKADVRVSGLEGTHQASPQDISRHFSGQNAYRERFHALSG